MHKGAPDGLRWRTLGKSHYRYFDGSIFRTPLRPANTPSDCYSSPVSPRLTNDFPLQFFCKVSV